MLWKKRLGLTKPLLEQFYDRLRSHTEWQENEDIFFNIYRPEFSLVYEDSEDWRRDNRPFYAQLMPDKKTTTFKSVL